MLFDAESGEHWFSPAHDVHVLEGVAAGDAFNAGLVHALINDFDPQDAVNYAIAASILKLTIKGDSNLVTPASRASPSPFRRPQLSNPIPLRPAPRFLRPGKTTSPIPVLPGIPYMTGRAAGFGIA